MIYFRKNREVYKMCIITGYTGNRRAAPIIIEMLKKTEYIDGGLSTGIATIHEGKLYYRKVVGDVDTLLRETDAMDLPGTTGIIHSRTGGNAVSHAHPFTSDDEELALVLNGTTWGGGNDEFYRVQNKIMNDYFDRGIEIKSAIPVPEGITPKRILKNGLTYHDSEVYALMIGEALKNSPNESIGEDIVRATREALQELPIDIITLSVHARLPDTVTIGTITRPMAVGFGDGETFMATCPIAFPEQIQKRPIVFLPPTTIAQATPSGLNIRSTSFDETRVEQIDYRTAKKIREDIEKVFSVDEEHAASIYDIPFRESWDTELWSKPLVDSKFVLEGSRLKPVGPAIYEGLWSLYKEGRLRMKLGTKSETNPGKIMRFWLE
jgi:hypothetical protein